ncbi:iron complex outermembrane recepter protein [Chitinophaga terrae (ex Kim and Jung 2007)]|uniref:Iron complex outermembrane recepter protein n=1 Tax=Chitinophaga terrae (ex Kim and Jung 2007) TaxID=408074 RepID=A0A1H4DXB1_9BACT|nr:TonB-dependent receptor [Chitinophaga terrae (ex Kim and Jung 2007)]SEA76842.1 iron complex outermembrane recepter protein [Chitinophaga terrae (ex Kim and Jung 2007)]
MNDSFVEKYCTVKLFSTLIIYLLTVNLVFAQNGHIRGTVRSSEGGAIPLATINIPAINKGGMADANGFFELKDIPAGTYDVHFSVIGFQPKKQKIVVAASRTADCKVVLTADLSKLNEVIVTGVSKATVIKKNPIPLAVIGRKEMNRNVNNNIIDAIIKEVPGISAVTTGPNISKPFIRGLGYNRVLTLYDGVRQEGQQWGDEHGIEIDQYGVTRVEVVKGPASLTYGSDALAGVINMIPEFPALDPGKISGTALVDYHSNNGMIGTSVSLGKQVKDWKYLLRGSAKAAHNYQNKVDGFVYGTAFREYNLSLLARVDKRWGNSQSGVTYYDNTQEIPDGSRDSLTRKFTYQVLEDDDIRNRPLVPDNRLKTYDLNPLHQRIQHARIYNNTSFRLGEGNLQTMLALQQSRRREYNHPEFPQQPGLYVVLNTLNYDIRYNLPAIKGIETTVGINGMYQTNRSRQATDFPIPDYQLFDIGGFLFAKRTFGRVDISGGIRYDNRFIEWNDFYVGPDKSNGLEKRVSPPDTAGARLQFPYFRHRYNGLSGSLGATWNISERLLLKANIARGYRAPNITEIGSNGLDPGAHIVYLGNRNFDPEFSLQEDVGMLLTLKDLDLNVALFHNSISGYIYQARLYDGNGNPVVIVPGNTTYSYQQSSARLYGAEIGVNIHPQRLPWLTVSSNLAIAQGRNRNKTLIAQYGDVARYLPLIPPTQWRSEVKVSAPEDLGCLRNAYIRAGVDVYANQSKFYGVDDSETFTPGYTLLSAGAGSSVVNKKGKVLFDLFLQVENIGDVAYQSNMNRLKYFEYYSQSPNGRSGIYNMGRNMSAKIIVPF